VILTEFDRARVTRSRAAQGLPERVIDTAVLTRVAVIMAGAQRGEAPVHQAGAPVNSITTTTTTAAKRGGRRVPN